MRKRILIPWSGGMDSTLLVYEAVKAGHKVATVHLNGGQPEKAFKAERGALQKLRTIVHERAVKAAHPDADPMHPVEISSRLEINAGATQMPTKQMPVWFMHCMSMIGANSDKANFDEVQLGYVLNDDAAASTPFLAEAWTALAKAIYGFDFEVPKLTFPLIRMRKLEVMKHLAQAHLLEHTWHCELPQLYSDGWRHCGKCISCERIRATKENEKFMEEYNRNFRDLYSYYDHTSEEVKTETEAEELQIEKA